MGAEINQERYFKRQIIARDIIKNLVTRAGLPPSTGMIRTNHPELGGGIIFSLGDPSNNETSFLVNSKGQTALWEQVATEQGKPIFDWVTKKPKKVINWLKFNKNLTESHLDIPSKLVAETY